MEKGLNNPALALMTSDVGKQAIANAKENQSKLIDIGFWLLKAGVLAGGAYFLYRKIIPNFKKITEDRNLPKSNISDIQAKNRAESIFTGMRGAGSGFDNTVNNLRGINHNGFIKIFNAFGERSGQFGFSKMNMIEWFQDQYSNTQLSKLRFIISGFF